jgi:hypothetical protein
MTRKDFPLVHQEPVSIVLVSFTEGEAMTLRNVLEYFNYRVEIHRVGSRPQFVEILRGNIPTFRDVLISCHGDGGGFVIPYQRPLTAEELGQKIHLPGQRVLSLGCATGSEVLANAFLAGGCEAYVGPAGGVEANAALLFAIHLYYFLAEKWSYADAVEEARRHDEDCKRFKLWLPQKSAGSP